MADWQKQVFEGFKVLRPGLVSALEDGVPIQYEIGEWVHPRGDAGPLCCFANMEDADRFRHHMYAASTEPLLLLAACEYVPSDCGEVWGEPVICSTMSDPVFRPRKVPMQIGQLFTGTVLASHVRLTEIIQDG
jgi:hypothetical protein